MRDKCPSKERHDRERSFHRDRLFAQRRQERQRLFGYVVLRNGEIIGIDEAIWRLRDGIRAKEKDDPKPQNAILQEDILAWHEPEVYHDQTVSKGEVDALDYFPALGIFPGVVLRDPKIRHRDFSY